MGYVFPKGGFGESPCRLHPDDLKSLFEIRRTASRLKRSKRKCANSADWHHSKSWLGRAVYDGGETDTERFQVLSSDYKETRPSFGENKEWTADLYIFFVRLSLTFPLSYHSRASIISYNAHSGCNVVQFNFFSNILP
jgi:hypothetical protein